MKTTTDSSDTGFSFPELPNFNFPGLPDPNAGNPIITLLTLVLLVLVVVVMVMMVMIVVLILKAILSNCLAPKSPGKHYNKRLDFVYMVFAYMVFAYMVF